MPPSFAVGRFRASRTSLGAADCHQSSVARWPLTGTYLANASRGRGSLGVAYLALHFYASRTLLPRLPVLYFLWEAVLLTLAWRLCYSLPCREACFSRRAMVIVRRGRHVGVVELLRMHAPDVKLWRRTTRHTRQMRPCNADGRGRDLPRQKAPLPPATFKH